MRRIRIVSALALLAIFAVACNQGGSTKTPGAEALTGTISADGSSTVFPVTQAIAEEWQAEAPDVQVSVGSSGTGGGFKKFCAGETDISDASRPIKDEEKAECEKNSVEYVELTVAIDGLSILTNPKNSFAQCLKTDELKKVFEPNSTVTDWSQIRSGFPKMPLRLYSPGTDSGTFDYFTAEINGEERASRNDELISFSEDDNALVRGVAGDDGISGKPLALGYFGFAYFEQNKSQLKALGVDSGEGCVNPTRDTINTGKYKPLSRPLFIYVAKDATQREEVKAFVDFYLETVNDILAEVGYIKVPDDTLEKSKGDWSTFERS
jgi:phosphate transport system substrate-binding protein